jgi:thioredoxin-like negative regulator of GroEL
LLKITNDIKEFKSEDECVVYFTANWCNPCKQLKPHYGRVSVMDPETNYYLVDVDKIDVSTIEYYKIQSIPQIFKMNKGEITDVIESRTTEAILEELGK